MKLYYPPNHYNPAYRGKVFPLLKAFLKGANFTDSKRKLLYGVNEADFVFVDTLEEAEVVILPMTWNYYTHTKQLQAAYALIAEAGQYNKIVWSVNAGDFGVKTPYYK